MGFSVGLGSLVDNLEFQRASNAVAAGTGDTTNFASIDMLEKQAVVCVAQMGAIVANAVTTLLGQESDDDSTFTNISGLSISVADDDDNTLQVMAAHRPLFTKRYFRCALVRATANATLAGANYVAAGHKTKPITQGSTVGNTDTL